MDGRSVDWLDPKGGVVRALPGSAAGHVRLGLRSSVSNLRSFDVPRERCRMGVAPGARTAVAVPPPARAAVTVTPDIMTRRAASAELTERVRKQFRLRGLTVF
ncbi:MAG: hypothetical protein ACOC3D_11535 [Pseudomonadota bacterium]